MSIWSKQALEQRVAGLEDELRAMRALVAGLAEAITAQESLDDRLAALEKSAETAGKDAALEFAQMRTALARIERQRMIDVEEARKVGAGLLERIELRRDASGKPLEN